MDYVMTGLGILGLASTGVFLHLTYKGLRDSENLRKIYSEKFSEIYGFTPPDDLNNYEIRWMTKRKDPFKNRLPIVF
ncbi:MAG: hypothetical protein KAS04_02390 [Candidatus Aenigmarchaeota archaeon]|nr:hypothetical protein [Candidatus Aenigmarchaeota archaeon]